MVGSSDSQKQFLSLIRDFSAEKSQGERRVVNLKKETDELRSQLEAAYFELEETKRQKEAMEKELKGYEVELSTSDASIKAQEARIAQTNSEISKLAKAMMALKSDENSSRDSFITQMMNLNAGIRKFHELFACVLSSKSSNGDRNAGFLETGANPKEPRCIAELMNPEHKQTFEVIHLQQELTSLERKVQLMEYLMKESMELKELSRQVSELEENCVVLVDKLQSNALCPRCHKDNSGELLQDLMARNS